MKYEAGCRGQTDKVVAGQLNTTTEEAVKSPLSRMNGCSLPFDICD